MSHKVSTDKAKIFISYSHKDEGWLKRILTHLKPLENRNRLQVWTDLQLTHGASWMEEIRQNIVESDIIILLTSADYLASDFIANVELPYILENARERGALLLNVSVSPYLWDAHPELARLQGIPNPNTPLSSLSSHEVEKVLVELARSINNHRVSRAKPLSSGTQKTFYVSNASITNLKCFSETSVFLNYPQRTQSSSLDNVNLFLGENGAGKTTICQALCLGVLRSLLALSGTGFRSSGLVRLGKDTAGIQLSVRSKNSDFDNTTRTNIIKDNDTEYLEPPTSSDWEAHLVEEHSPAMFVAAYGANRRTERPEAYNDRLRNLRYQRVASLFEPHIGLLPLLLALEYSKGRQEEVASLVNQLLPETVQLTLTKEEPLFKAFGAMLPLSGLSDGYRLHISWVVDLVCQLARVLPADKPLHEAEGIVMVDEIDLLLHPEWQRHVVPTLSKAFPNIQFLLTTHSPIVAGTLESKNLFLIESIPSKEERVPFQSVIQPCTEPTQGLSIDTLLVRLFGLQSPRAPYLETQLSELEAKAREGDEDAALEYLRRLRLGSEKQ